MKRYFFRRFDLRKARPMEYRQPFGALSAISLLAGILAALAVIQRTPGETIKGFGDAIILSGSEASVLSAYWKCSRYHIFTALLSTSFLGAVAIPVLLAYKGFTLCCTSAALILDHPANGAMLSAIILGLPGLISLPCLFVISMCSMQASAQLMSSRFGLRQRYPMRCEMRRVCLCLAFLIPVAVYESRMLPKLIKMIIP